jgi:signal transduction histidine kinase
MATNEIQQLKNELREKDDLLKVKNLELSSYFFTVSHELKTPLSAASGYIALLEQFYAKQLNGEAAHYLDRISSNLNQMQRLVDDLVEFSKIQIDQEQFTPIGVQEILEEALLELQFLILQKKAHIEITNGFPEVRGHKKLITRVFINLISNAIKYARKETSPEVKIGYIGSEIFHKFFVQDNGIGIKNKNLPRLFQLFSRLADKQNIEGSGLGLAIARRIIEGHGGEIWVESKPGKGSTFYLTLPK